MSDNNTTILHPSMIVSFCYNGKDRYGTITAVRQTGIGTLFTIDNKSYYYHRCEKFNICHNPRWYKKPSQSGYQGTGEPYDAWKDRQLELY